MASKLAVTFVISSLLGLLRDVAAIRSLGFGSESDEFFVVMSCVLVFFGLGGQATYLPLAMRRPRAAAAFLWTAAATMAGVTLLLTRPESSVDILASVVACPLLAAALPRLITLVDHRQAGRLGSVPVVGNVAVLFALAVCNVAHIAMSPTLLGLVYAAGLTLALVFLAPRSSPWRRPRGGPAHGGTSTFLLVSTGLQLYPLLERSVANELDAGTNTLLAIGSKLAAVPVGVLGYAVGTAAFMRVASRAGEPFRGVTLQGRLSRLGHSRATLLFGVVVMASAVAALVSIPVVIATGPLLGIPADASMADEVVVAFCLSVVPGAVVSGIAMQELQALGEFSRYTTVGIVFISAYTVMALLALATHSPLFLSGASGVAFLCGLVAIYVTGRSSEKSVGAV